MAQKSIRVFTGGAPRRVLERLAPAFEREMNCRVDVLVKIVGDIQALILAGDHPDIVLLPQILMRQIKDNLEISSEGYGPLARVGIGVVTQKGRNLPDFSDLQGFTNLLLKAGQIVMADPRTPTGRHLAKLFEELKIADQLAGKLIHHGAIHGGGALVAQGDAGIGLFLVSEVQHLPGVDLAGLLPMQAQNEIIYWSAVPATSAHQLEALQFLQFLKAVDHHQIWRESGFEPEIAT